MSRTTSDQKESQYEYDYSNRLKTVKKNSAVQGKYVYDADGKRVKHWNPSGGWTTTINSGLNIVYEDPESGSPTKHFYANGLHLAEKQGDTWTYYHQDHLGSTRLQTNSTGDVIYSSNYEPFGPEYGEYGTETYRYTGKPEDNTGLYYYGARYYDPHTGRFITRDSILGKMFDPQSMNRYIYCRNNPQKYIDIDGNNFGYIDNLLTQQMTQPDYNTLILFSLIGFANVLNIV